MKPADASGSAGGATAVRPTVGIIGLGHMGSAMASRLCAEGYPLRLYNRTLSRAEELADRLAEGGPAEAPSVAGSPAEVAASADVLITMVADDAAVTELYRSSDGVLAGLSERSIAVDMSTCLPDTIRALERDVRATGAGILDAPVSGSVPLAEKGQLTLMVGGDGGDLERARPALEGLGSRIFHLGPLGAGATMKLSVNAIVFGLGGAIAEALVLAEKSGVDPSIAYDVFAASAIGSPFVGYKREAFLDPGATPVAFSIGLARKDLRLILELAERVGAAMPQARNNLEVLAQAGADVGQERDFAAVAVHLRRGRAGMA
jgi:3-hydroxyisobutyrate dehydrogenase/2-hydroxy-3-oxopropionate reductase